MHYSPSLPQASPHSLLVTAPVSLPFTLHSRAPWGQKVKQKSTLVLKHKSHFMN